jgi:paraquat-inducible protein A
VFFVARHVRRIGRLRFDATQTLSGHQKHYLPDDMKILPSVVVCARCDAVYRRPVLVKGQTAHCRTCGAVVWRSGRISVDRWLALTLTSAILFALANLFPVIRIGVQNFQNDVTLWGATTTLIKGHWAPMAMPAIVVAIIAPLMHITLLGWVLMFAWFGKRAPGFRQAMKILAVVRPWSMIEVAMFSVIVAGIKLSSMANMSLGEGSWAMLALTCLATLTNRWDLRWLWNAAYTHPRESVPQPASTPSLLCDS